MKGRLALLLAASSLLVSVSAVLAWSGATASAAPRHAGTVLMSEEAWYDEPPPCVSLIDCSPVPATSPYPKKTVHVAVTAGQETARTYLAFSTGASKRRTVIGGTLTLPVDASASDGSLSPDQAALQACLVTASFKPVRGSTSKPPRAKCHVFSAATYDAKTASFTIDLTPFATRWHAGRAALALVPATASAQPGATWHVAFHATTKPSKDAPPITATFEYLTAPPAGPSHSGDGSATGGSTASSGGGSSFGSSSGGGGSFSASFPPSSITRTTTTTTTTTTAPAQAQPGLVAPVSLEGFAGPGFAYPAVWALPLLFLVGIGAVGRALTKELYRRSV